MRPEGVRRPFAPPFVDGAEPLLRGGNTIMSLSDRDARLTREELAWELAEIFAELPVERINEMLSKNIPYETLDFIARYAEDFADVHGVEGSARRNLPNLFLLGYLMRIVEDRLIDDDSAA